MSSDTLVHRTGDQQPRAAVRPGEPCLIIIFGAMGDLTKRLLMPALYNLACDGLLAERLAIVGVARRDLSNQEYRTRITADVQSFNTRPSFDSGVWEKLASRLHYSVGDFDDLPAYSRLQELTSRLDQDHQTGGNILFYLATPPAVFGVISTNLAAAGFKKRSKGLDAHHYRKTVRARPGVCRGAEP